MRPAESLSWCPDTLAVLMTEGPAAPETNALAVKGHPKPYNQQMSPLDPPHADSCIRVLSQTKCSAQLWHEASRCSHAPDDF